MKLTQNLGLVIMALGSFLKMKANLKYLSMVMDGGECKGRIKETGSRTQWVKVSGIERIPANRERIGGRRPVGQCSWNQPL